MSNEEQRRRASETVQRLFLFCQLLGLALAGATGYLIDHMPLRIIIASLMFGVLVILLVRRWQRKAGIPK